MANTSFKDYLKEKIKQKPNLAQEIEESKRAIKIAHQIYQLRRQRGLTQKGLAKLISVSQSNIARIESADYNHYTITTLHKVAKGLGADLNIFINPPEQTINLISAVNIHPTFQNFDFAGGSGGYIVSGIETLNREDAITVESITESEEAKVFADYRESGAETKINTFSYATL